MDLRCPYKLHGLLHADGVLEVRCKSRKCGAKPGVVVIHRFKIPSGELIDTRRHRDINPTNKEEAHGADRRCVPVRSS